MKDQEKKDYILRVISLYEKMYDGEAPSLEWILNKASLKHIDDGFTRKVLEDGGWLKPHLQALESGEKGPSKLGKFFDFFKSKLNKKERTEEKEKFNTEIDSSWVFVIKVSLIFIGVGATFMSINYSYLWLEDFMQWYLAALLSTIMVLFAVISFELIFLVAAKIHAKWKFVPMAFLAALWIIVTSFSIVSTVAGQYDARLLEAQEKRKEIALSGVDLDKANLIREKIAKERTELEKVEREIGRLSGMLDEYKTADSIRESKDLYEDLKWDREEKEKERKAIAKRLEKEQEALAEIGIPEKNELDFYSWVAGLFDLSPDSVQLWLSLFPAIFIDLIAPFSLLAAIFIK